MKLFLKLSIPTHVLIESSETWLWEVTLSIVLGLLIGWVARKSLRWCEERHMLDEDNFVAYGTGLSFFCLGFLGIVGIFLVKTCEQYLRPLM
jgi:NhaP-type Na+/H+ or K+/H+ antiporter